MTLEASLELADINADDLEKLNQAIRTRAAQFHIADSDIDYAQLLFLIAATAVASAYNLYPCNPPNDPNYYDVNVVQVLETAEASYRAKTSPSAAARLAADRASGDCDLGFINFGFAATSIDNLYNILALRGTQTAEEAVYDIYNWDDVTQAVLPTQTGVGADQGNVKQALWDFYSEGLAGYDRDSLAQACINAIQATEQAHPGLPWLVCAHSLGGPMANLAAMDATLSGAMPMPLVITFGSLHLGDATFAANYTSICPVTYRMANLADFVPAMIALEPGTDTTHYVHVGEPVSFVWQTWSDWQNHSMTQTYLATIGSQWDVVTIGPVQFPCATAPPAAGG
ncbi:lipase family protein [Sphingomonas hylomeconis]|uniref:Fungal lipase-type domain-containing protein n=1 Tax=Sphingomonas hylomeconis TaxID=1395958 RepID=A0ABV7SY20_9SPHN|nr:hypothetical protein [Sphingomonas hylomeconis]